MNRPIPKNVIRRGKYQLRKHAKETFDLRPLRIALGMDPMPDLKLATIEKPEDPAK